MVYFDLVFCFKKSQITPEGDEHRSSSAKTMDLPCTVLHDFFLYPCGMEKVMLNRAAAPAALRVASREPAARAPCFGSFSFYAASGVA